MRDLLDFKDPLRHFPEQLVCLRRPQLVPEQNDAFLGHKSLHGRDQRAHRLLDVDDVRGQDDVVRRLQGLYLIGVVPVEH
ncbi:hypothetical protein PanWU01x14_266770 [Parasponia andersonii]|uniref:Uncharacterized protein n=1 Tax=Parasponia andersonii TaxID=3476 RepID=A0A2P5B6L6_PARAD|nr:hypothetical protein PanWU01x14_266770 [Parasponia andersonii]